MEGEEREREMGRGQRQTDKKEATNPFRVRLGKVRHPKFLLAGSQICLLSGSGIRNACWGGVRGGLAQRQKGKEHGQTEAKDAEQYHVGHVAIVGVIPVNGARRPCVVHAVSEPTSAHKGVN